MGEDPRNLTESLIHRLRPCWVARVLCVTQLTLAGGISSYGVAFCICILGCDIWKYSMCRQILCRFCGIWMHLDKISDCCQIMHVLDALVSFVVWRLEMNLSHFIPVCKCCSCYVLRPVDCLVSSLRFVIGTSHCFTGETVNQSVNQTVIQHQVQC